MSLVDSLSTSEETISKQKNTDIKATPIKDTEGQAERSSCYNLYYEKTESGIELLSRKKETKSVRESFQQIAVAEAVNRLLREASDTVNNLVSTEDPIEQTNLAFAFKHCLQDLWKNKYQRENNWGDLVNILQAVLAQVEFEQLSSSQKSGLKKVVSEYLCKADVADADMEEALEVLSEAGLDPWRGISGKSQG